MKYIKSFVLLILAVIATSCTTYSDEPGGGGTIFIPHDVVDCTIIGTVQNHATFGRVWNVSEMTVYRDWRINSADGKLTFVKAEERKETFSSTTPCYVALPKEYQNSQIGDVVDNLPLQMVIEKGTIGDSKNVVTLGSVIKILTQEDLDRPVSSLK